ncbi:methyl-accepting chemotaxis protein [Thiospirochaeta perfilievii]|nr:methyl-accepting chemotaxis protein [Thiospirochaeta perfilievii]
MTNIQIERGLSSNYINGDNNKSKITEARSNVDKSYIETNDALYISTLYNKGKDEYESLTKTIKSLRTQVDNKSITAFAVMENYTTIINILIKLNLTAVSEKTAGGIGKRLTGLNALIEIQESAGRFRGYASSVIKKNEAIPTDVVDIIYSDFNTIALSLKSSSILLTDNSKKVRTSLLESNELRFLKEVHNRINSNYKFGEYNLDSTKVWSDGTRIISQIQEMISIESKYIAESNIKIINNLTATRNGSIIGISVTTLFIFLLSIFITSYIIKRINKVTHRLEAMSAGGGDLTHLLEEDINDDIGKLSNAFNSYISSLALLISDIKETGINFVEFSNQLKTIITEVNSSNDNVNTSLGSVELSLDKEKNSVISLKEEMDQVVSYTNKLSGAVEEQMTAVEESSAAVEQMIANIRTVTTSVERTAGIVENLSTSGIKGKEQINQVTHKINTVFELSNSLKSANALIADIADRTSLLSMNAAIEAAHAGDAGKGFAVVADEIRKLSESTASQSKGITENLGNIIVAISAAVQSSTETEKTFTDITDKIEAVAQNQDQIKSAMTEQNQGSNEILEAMSVLKTNSYTVDSTVSELNTMNNKMQDEEEAVYKIIIDVTDSANIMSNAVTQIGSKLQELTTKEITNNNLVNKLSKSMDQFTVN